MTDPEVLRRRAQKRLQAPFESLLKSEANASPEERTAHAMEYAAAQLGEIRRLLEKGAEAGSKEQA